MSAALVGRYRAVDLLGRAPQILHEIRRVAERIHWAAAWPDVRFEEIAGAGHVCNLERPGAYNAVLAAFLGRVTATDVSGG